MFFKLTPKQDFFSSLINRNFLHNYYQQTVIHVIVIYSKDEA